MKTVEVKLYQYDELSPEAQEKARDWYREGCYDDCSWAEMVIEDAKELGALMGITVDHVYYSGFYSQGDGACFEGSYSSESIKLATLMATAPNETELHRICQELRDIRGKTWLRIEAQVKQSGHYYHSRCTEIDTTATNRKGEEREITGKLEGEITELLRDFMGWIYRALEREYEYQMSDECAADNIRCNEYEFDEKGARA